MRPFFKRSSVSLFFACFLLSASALRAQVVINELIASNASGITDPDFYDNTDWIELYNAGSSVVN
nr:hypothetical protein [Saprospiraceae bacterium]